MGRFVMGNAQGRWSDTQGQWPTIASNWKRIGPPLRPVTADLDFCQRAIDDWHSRYLKQALDIKQAPHALVLGATPEYFHLNWPSATLLRALDRTPEMIEYIWPGAEDSAILGRWENSPLSDASIDIALCDGGLHLLDFPDGQRLLVAELSRVVRKNGVCIFRLFSLPKNEETPDQVQSALFRGEIRNLNELKLRLGMALQMQSFKSSSVKLDDVYSRVMSWTSDLRELAEKLSWDFELLRALEAYRGLQTRYHFTSTAAAIDLFINTGAFELRSLDHPHYAMGDQCPTVVFTRV